MRIRQAVPSAAVVRLAAALFAFTYLAAPARASVVINEILYHAPDDLDNVQFIELYNTGEAAVDFGHARS